MNPVRRIFVEKKSGYDVEARNLLCDIQENLQIQSVKNLRIVNRYDISGISDYEFEQAQTIIFSEATVDNLYFDGLPVSPQDIVFAVEYLPGQYDQRADWAEQCIQILTQQERPRIAYAKIIVLEGNISNQELARIKDYYINPIESREAGLERIESIGTQVPEPDDVSILTDFTKFSSNQLQDFANKFGLAMSREDLEFCQTYFRDTERRDPTITEIKVIDTYWSDHCRHTTFNTRLEDIQIDSGYFAEPIKIAYQNYLNSREYIYGNNPKDICLMDIAVLGMKELKKRNLLPDLDESEEINACSIVVTVDHDGSDEEWLVMFKNETHNHPTEIEPFGGAATCLGGAIRDPLSGRSYVYQAMRVTGSGDPRVPVENTLAGKLPQRKITIGAAQGYSSYGNQIGLATGQVAEFYHEKFIAKRMEIGAVIGAAPRENIVRKNPIAGDIILLVGGRTGRDGCGGATGSSKEHTCDSLQNCGAEVQKGNAPTERKIQRLFRNPAVSRLIKKCNDFGAGGVSVAIGELTDSIEINLDAVPKKYEGLDGTELAISESQERMAVVVAAADVQQFLQQAWAENLEATPVAKVTADQRLKMIWRNEVIVDIKREFLDTNGIQQKAQVKVIAPDQKNYYFERIPGNVKELFSNIEAAWLKNLQDLNVCSQKGLVERFDSTIGAATVLMPFGGKYQLTPAEGMVAKIPVLDGRTNTASAMTFGYHPDLADWSPFHGGLYAVVEAVSKMVMLGGDYRQVRLTLQEYFEKLGKDPSKWGKPFSALLGALYAQQQLGIAAIGGKDSMSGTFMDIHVPPTLVAFGVSIVRADQVISQEFKQQDSPVVVIPCSRDEFGIPDFAGLRSGYSKINELIKNKLVLSANIVKSGGIAATVSKMCFGNQIGFEFQPGLTVNDLFINNHGSIVLELANGLDLNSILSGVVYQVLGRTKAEPQITFGQANIKLDKALAVWEQPLEKVFPTKTENGLNKIMANSLYTGGPIVKCSSSFAKPRVFIPVFPGTNCEYDSARAFADAGAVVNNLVIRNRTAGDIEQSINETVAQIASTQIIMLAGGFSASDEPDGSGKFIATMFRNPRIKDAIMNFLQNQDGLILGICNGFQALIKLGLVPYGEIVDISEDCPTLTYNQIGRHVSCYVRTKVLSNLSPWFNNTKPGDIHTIAVSHGEGRFIANQSTIARMLQNGQIATQYVDIKGQPTDAIPFNPNGSVFAVEGITSPDGRVLGKMGHTERIGSSVGINISGNKNQGIFAAGIKYFG